MITWHKTLSATAIAALSLTLFVGSAVAQTPDTPTTPQEQRVDARQERQAARITQGVHSGQLTLREQRRLQRQQRHVNHMERRIEADGTVTGKEALGIEKAQDRASHKIRRNKHDRQQRAR